MAALLQQQGWQLAVQSGQCDVPARKILAWAAPGQNAHQSYVHCNLQLRFGIGLLIRVDYQSVGARPFALVISAQVEWISL